MRFNILGYIISLRVRHMWDKLSKQDWTSKFEFTPYRLGIYFNSSKIVARKSAKHITQREFGLELIVARVCISVHRNGAFYLKLKQQTDD